MYYSFVRMVTLGSLLSLAWNFFLLTIKSYLIRAQFHRSTLYRRNESNKVILLIVIPRSRVRLSKIEEIKMLKFKFKLQIRHDNR